MAQDRTQKTSTPSTILLVDDEQSLLSLMGRDLEEHGFTVLKASNGEEALHLCQRYVGPIHLLLADIFLPTEDQPSTNDPQAPWVHGLGLARRVKALRPHIQVLLISGRTDEEIFALGGIKPGTPFLKKPFSSDTLIRKVREVLNVTQ
ncbi:MAG: response regulator [Nitrospirae bacterium]|nr:MAG: response regulator [Nitrospirota bacterium]TLY41942.1 MAG: response regulator [Nitrospirota bacterium]